MTTFAAAWTRRGLFEHNYGRGLLGSLGGALLLTGLATAGCSDGDAARADESGSDADDAQDGSAGGAGSGPLYAVMYEVYDDVSSNSYLSLIDSLDLGAIDPSKAREFAGGRAFLQSYGGRIYIGEPSTPTVTKYSVNAQGKLVKEGEISFSNYGFDGGQFDSWNATFLSPHKAYLMNFVDGTTIIWDPTDMQIVGEIPPPDELQREGWQLEGSPAGVRGDRLFRTFNWANYDEGTYREDFFLAVYDTAQDELLELHPETRCPTPGNLVHTDEAGNIYFSNWIWPVGNSFVNDAPAPCVLRINEGESVFDPEWTFDYSTVADGRQGGMFTYLQDQQALISVFYDERTSIDETSTTWTYAGTNNWRLWSVDLEKNTGAPLEGLDFNGGAFTPIQFDGRLLVMVPGGAEDNYATQIYEVKDKKAEPRVKLPGWSYQFVKIR